ncbi:NADH-quinone oxidoreductase subunit L, partial [Candidatus Poribacteria bacterium]|nr:NADH-quinone oxidoreductase subunit L [Candidatus Poribacteria bacterium]
VSQLGYMFVGVGVGAYAAGIFHLMTHAFFKGLMFLAAGSVMHAMSNELDMRKMGGLKSKLPHTYWTFLIGAIAIAGIPPLSGFWSKDEILHAAWNSDQPGHQAIFFIGLITAGLTAFYMFRLIWVTFHGESRVDPHVESHLHESPAVMWIPLWLLAIPSALIGLALLSWKGEASAFHRFVEEVFEHGGAADHSVSSSNPLIFMVISTVVGVVGGGLAIAKYRKSVPATEPTNPLHKVLANKYYVDEIYNAVFVQPIKGVSQYLFWKIMDIAIIDGIVNLTGFLVRGIGGLIRRLQTGIVHSYIASMVVGIVLFLAYYLFIR